MKSILLHGLGQSAASWDATVKTMGQTSDIVCPELSEWITKGAAGYADLYRGLENWCVRLDGSLNLCGLSLGGILALQFGIEHPEKVNSLVLIGTQYVMPKGLLKIQNALFRLMPRHAFEELGIAKRDFIDLCVSMLDLDFRAGVERIHCPVLVVCGEKDGANKRASAEMTAQIPHAELVMVSDAGHEVNREKPDQLGRIISRFFRENS